MNVPVADVSVSGASDDDEENPDVEMANAVVRGAAAWAELTMTEGTQLSASVPAENCVGDYLVAYSEIIDDA